MLFQNIKKRVIHPDTFYEIIINQITKTDKGKQQKKKLQANILDEQKYKNRYKTTNKVNPTAQEKDFSP